MITIFLTASVFFRVLLCHLSWFRRAASSDGHVDRDGLGAEAAQAQRRLHRAPERKLAGLHSNVRSDEAV